MTTPLYQEYAPRAALADYVQCVWTYSAPADETPQPIAPDGRCELIVHLRKSYEEVGARRVVQPPVIFAGQITKPLTLVARSDVYVLGVRFRPDGARALLGFDLDAATDKRVDLAAEHGDAAAALPHNIWEESRIERQIAVAEDYVEARIQTSQREPRIDPIVRAAVTRLLAGEAADAVGLSERQMQRRFKAEVGVSARMLATVLRFRRVFEMIERPEAPGWVEAALAAGYFDQPHMARDFRRFLGCTARQWAMHKAGLSKALAAAAPETYKKESGAPR